MWSRSETKDYLTSYCEGLSAHTMDIGKSIVGFRDSKYVFYAMNKSVIKGNSQHNHPNGAIGKYVNVHRLVVDPTTMKCSCSCGRKAQNGRPCVHMCVIVPVFGPQMFSPRWYKSWNSDLFENQKINGVLTAMRKTHEGSSRGWCPIDCLWENTEFKNVEYINGCDANIEKVMRAITRMNEASTVCLLGEVGPMIPMDYMEKGTQTSAAWRQQSREFFAGCEDNIADNEDIYVLNADQNLMSNHKLYSEI